MSNSLYFQSILQVTSTLGQALPFGYVFKQSLVKWELGPFLGFLFGISIQSINNEYIKLVKP